MDYKTKSILLVIVLAGMMVGIGLLTNIGITGSIVADNIACDEDGDCNDKIEETEDICKNPGTKDSFCVNRLIK